MGAEDLGLGNGNLRMARVILSGTLFFVLRISCVWICGGVLSHGGSVGRSSTVSLHLIRGRFSFSRMDSALNTAGFLFVVGCQFQAVTSSWSARTAFFIGLSSCRKCALLKYFLIFRSILFLMEYMLASHLSARMGVLLRAPIAILRAVFWMVSSFLSVVLQAEPYATDPYSTLLRMNVL